MTDIYLVMEDVALRAAVTEALEGLALGAVHLGFAAFAKAIEATDTASVLIVDVCSADTKLEKSLRDLPKDRILCVLVLGVSSLNEEVVTETLLLPVRLGHLLSRIQFYVQAVPRLRGAVLEFGPYTFSAQSRQVVKKENGDVIRLTEKETALLGYLGQSQTFVSREELLAAIWGYDGRIDTHTLETHIYQLRRKLDPEGTGEAWVVNEAGGYSLRR